MSKRNATNVVQCHHCGKRPKEGSRYSSRWLERHLTLWCGKKISSNTATEDIGAKNSQNEPFLYEVNDDIGTKNFQKEPWVYDVSLDQAGDTMIETDRNIRATCKQEHYSSSSTSAQYLAKTNKAACEISRLQQPTAVQNNEKVLTVSHDDFDETRPSCVGEQEEYVGFVQTENQDNSLMIGSSDHDDDDPLTNLSALEGGFPAAIVAPSNYYMTRYRQQLQEVQTREEIANDGDFTDTIIPHLQESTRNADEGVVNNKSSVVDLTTLQERIKEHYAERTRLSASNALCKEQYLDRSQVLSKLTDCVVEMHHNPAEYALRQYITKYPLRNLAAGDELLRLIKYLALPSMQQHTQSLPSTIKTLFEHDMHLNGAVSTISNDLDEERTNEVDGNGGQGLVPRCGGTGVNVSSISLDLYDASWSVPFAHFSLLSIIADLLVRHTTVASKDHLPRTTMSDDDSEPSTSMSFEHSTTTNSTPQSETNSTRKERVYDEVYSGDWWLEAQTRARRTNPSAKLLAILLYMDGVSVDFFNRVHMTPIVVTLGNFTKRVRDSIKGKRLLGFIPALSDIDIKAHTTADPTEVRRVFKQKCLKVLLQPLLEAQRQGGLQAYLNFKDIGTGQKVCLYPCISYFIGDNEELTRLAGVKAGHKTHRQCRCCLLPTRSMHNFFASDDFRDGRRDHSISRTTQLTQKRYEEILLKHSLYPPEDNFLLQNSHMLFGLGDERSSSFYESFPPDNLHTLLSGVMRYAAAWTLDVVKQTCGTDALNKLDKAISSYNTGSATDMEFEFICPTQGVSHIVKLVKASKKRKKDNLDTINVLPKKCLSGKRRRDDEFREDNSAPCDNSQGGPASSRAAPKYTSNFESRQWAPVVLALACVLGSSDENEYLPSDHPSQGNIRSEVVLALFLCMDLFFELRKTDYKETNLIDLERKTIPNALHSIYNIFIIRQQLRGESKHFSGYKLHILTHIPRLIRRFGAPCNWDTASFETSHKKFVKERWESGSKQLQGLEKRILQQDELHCILTAFCGVDRYGNVSTFYTIQESGITEYVRAWKTIIWDDETTAAVLDPSITLSQSSAITYRFIHSCYRTEFINPPQQEGINSMGGLVGHNNSSSGKKSSIVKWKLTKEDMDQYSPPLTVKKWLVHLLVQYAKIDNGSFLKSVFPSVSYFSLRKLQVLLNDHIAIEGSGVMSGYEQFTIQCNPRYGKSNLRPGRERYDFVEVTIPVEKQGKIAGSDQLLRTSDEFAIAQVKAIVILRVAETEVPLLYVMFLRKGLGNRRPREITTSVNKRMSEYIGKLDLVSYGTPNPEWVSLYPLVTLKAPCLGVQDVRNDKFFHVFPMKYISRGNWYDEKVHDLFTMNMQSNRSETFNDAAVQNNNSDNDLSEGSSENDFE